jgi:flagellar hook-associated protein 1 FlgK
MGIFGTLDIGYSGLKANQLGVTTVGHNISNANNEKYTRQVVVQSTQSPMPIVPGAVGRGVQTDVIIRVHDEFVFDRLKDAEADAKFADLEKSLMSEASKLFTDLDGTGIANDMKNYYDAWNDLASNPADPSVKVVLAQYADNMASHIKDTRSKLVSMQGDMNTKLEGLVNEINDLGERIAQLNGEISASEVAGARANDLRDERDHLELTISKMINLEVHKGELTTENHKEYGLADLHEQYVSNIGGHSFVDGTTFHPIVVSDSGSQSGMFNIYHQRQDDELIDITNLINKGEMGAIIKLRGGAEDPHTGLPSGGLFTDYINQLDTLAEGIIERTNNVYAQTATAALQSPNHSSWLNQTDSISNIDDKQIHNGTFDVVVYDTSGNEVARRSITIDANTAMDDGTADSIISKMTADLDDNNDNSNINDVDDLTTVNFAAGVFTLNANSGYTVALEDDNTNFPGVIGINQFFSGTKGDDIALRSEFKEDPTLIQAYKAPHVGSNEMANDMVNLQYQEFDLTMPDGHTLHDTTLEGMYRYIAGNVSADAQLANGNSESANVLKDNIDTEYKNISGVNIDEELTNLMKFQTGYAANAKIISAVDQMLDTLLGMR